MKIVFDDEAAMFFFAGELCCGFDKGGLVLLSGPLGAGKTTFVKSILKNMGFDGIVKSPTYTLVESYSLETVVVHHFDLYRMVDPEELELLGVRDYLSANDLCFVEWPERGENLFPLADIQINLDYLGRKRVMEIKPISPLGDLTLAHLRI